MLDDLGNNIPRVRAGVEGSASTESSVYWNAECPAIRLTFLGDSCIT